MTEKLTREQEQAILVMKLGEEISHIIARLFERLDQTAPPPAVFLGAMVAIAGYAKASGLMEKEAMKSIGEIFKGMYNAPTFQPE